MANIGKATLTIVPKFDNLGKTVTSALGGVSTASVGKSAGEEYSGGFETGVKGLGASGAVIGAFSAVTQSAMNLISSSVSSAISRLDTLNTYPRVMESLGYTSEEASESISQMSEHLSGLPTALDDMASTVQGLAAITGDLGEATDAGLALNDMLLAAGSSTAEAASAAEQFRQMLSKGVPDMQDWKSLTSAMPGQMKQLAEEMLGAGASANDLYYALGGGGEEATLTMDELLEAMVRLDTEGSESVTSFAQQAKDATGGVQSSMENMQTAVARGVAEIMEAVGTDTISEACSGIGSAFEDGLGTVADVVSAVMPSVKTFASLLSKLSPAVLPAAASLASLAAAGKGLNGVAGIVSGATASFSGLKKVAGTASESLLTLAGSMKSGSKASEGLLKAATSLSGSMGGALVAGVGAAAVAVGLLVSAYMDAKEKAKTFEKATTGLTDAVSDVTALDNVSASIGSIGTSASGSALSVDELAESMAEYTDAISETASTAAAEISTLETARQVISDYSGMSDLSAEAQGRLEWAIGQVNEQLGLSLDSADVVNGYYTDQNGVVQDLTDSVNALVEAKKNEIKVESLSESLSEAYEASAEAADTLAQAQRDVAQAQSDLDAVLASNEENPWATVDPTSYVAALAEANDELDKAEDAYGSATDAVSLLEEELGDASRAASDSADEFDEWGNSLSDLFEATLQDGTTLAGLKDDLRDLGASTEDLSRLSEDELLELAGAYDGTAASVAGALDGMKVSMDEAARDSALAAGELMDAVEDMGVSFDGIDTETLCQKLADAEVSTDELKEYGGSNIAELAEICNGNLDSMVYYIEHYNDAEIADKDGNIVVDEAELIDAQGNVYTWNGTALVDKDGKAVVDDVELLDAHGNVYEWNDLKLKGKSAIAQVTGNVADGSAEDRAIDAESAVEALKSKSVEAKVTGNYSSANSTIWDLGNAIKNLASKTVNVVANTFGSSSKNAAGGIRYHADGAIATRAVPLDNEGEDGAEAIVPLTNKRYSLPFAQLIADEIDAGGQTTVNYYIGDTNVTGTGGEAFAEEFVALMERYGRLSRL